MDIPQSIKRPGYSQDDDYLRSYLDVSGLSDKRDALEQQIQQAIALRNRPKHQYTTWGGALAGGLGDLLGDVASQTKENSLRAQEAPLEEQIAQGRKNYGEGYIAKQRADEERDAQLQAKQQAWMQQKQLEAEQQQMNAGQLAPSMLRRPPPQPPGMTPEQALTPFGLGGRY